MHIVELYQLTEWINKEIKEVGIIEKYQNLQSILHQNTRQNQQLQPFDDQKKDLIEVLMKVPLNRLSIEQLDYLARLNITPYVGNEGIDHIENILFRNVIDIATSAKAIQEIINTLNNALKKSDQIYQGLTGCVDLAHPEFKEVLIRVSFTGDAAIENVADLKRWGSTWYDIARGISMAHGSAPEDVRVIGAARGSLIIELGVAYIIAHTTSKIILSALEVANRILDIRKKAEEVRNLRLSNIKIAKEMEKEADQVKASGIEKIGDEIVAELKLKSDGEGDKITALKSSVEKLINFVDKGGSVDFIMKEETDDMNDASANKREERHKTRKELRAAFEEIRRLENEIKLLEENNPVSTNL